MILSRQFVAGTVIKYRPKTVILMKKKQRKKRQKKRKNGISVLIMQIICSVSLFGTSKIIKCAEEKVIICNSEKMVMQ